MAGCLAWAENKAMGVSSGGKQTAAKNASNWPGTYMTMEKVAKYWRGDWISKHWSALGVTKEWMLAVDKLFPSAIYELTDYALAQNLKTKLPRTLLNKDLMDEFWAERQREFGRVSRDWHAAEDALGEASLWLLLG